VVPPRHRRIDQTCRFLLWPTFHPRRAHRRPPPSASLRP
jgi:hypothetical protein